MSDRKHVECSQCGKLGHRKTECYEFTCRVCVDYKGTTFFGAKHAYEWFPRSAAKEDTRSSSAGKSRARAVGSPDTLRISARQSER